MSEENVEIVRAAIEEFNRGDINGVVADFAPDFELDFSRAAGPTAASYGLDQTRGFVDELGGSPANLRGGWPGRPSVGACPIQ